MRWSLRAAEAADASAIVAVVEAGFETYRRFGPPDWTPPREDLDRLRDEMTDPRTFTRVAEAGGAVAGAVHAIAGERGHPGPEGWVPDVHLRYLFVTEPFWGSGVALALHRAFVEHLGDRTGRLFTPSGQARARRFYEREGWRPAVEIDPSDFGMPLVEYRRP